MVTARLYQSTLVTRLAKNPLAHDLHSYKGDEDDITGAAAII
jgi:hypothetical protein